MATLRNAADIDMHLAEMYDLQREKVHIHFVKLGHKCADESAWELMIRAAPIHPTIKVYFYHERVSALIKTLQRNLKQDIDCPSSRICPACGHLPQDADIEDEASGSGSSN